MNRHVTIRVKSVQKTKGEEEQVIELVTEAQMTTRDGSVFLTYEESELSGIDGAKTQLQIGDDFVRMRRAYHGVTEMFFEINKRSTSEYHTPYGKFKLEAMTRSLAICLRPVLRIDIEYDISLQSMFESTNRLQIEVLGYGP
jgi:uncharacterized beta-barrel protein YwiB (DUF1934 family)